MDCGTIIYPKPLDFPILMDVQTTQRAIDTQVREMTKDFGVFRTFSVCTPRDISENPLKEVTEEVEKAFRKYVSAYEMMQDLQDAIDIYNQQLEIESNPTYENDSPKLPFFYYAGFLYSLKEEAEADLLEKTNELSKIKARILGICLSTPIDITPRDITKYVDGHYEPIYYLESELNYQEDALEQCLQEIRTIKLIIKYWDERKVC